MFTLTDYLEVVAHFYVMIEFYQPVWYEDVSNLHLFEVDMNLFNLTFFLFNLF